MIFPSHSPLLGPPFLSSSSCETASGYSPSFSSLFQFFIYTHYNSLNYYPLADDTPVLISSPYLSLQPSSHSVKNLGVILHCLSPAPCTENLSPSSNSASKVCLPSAIFLFLPGLVPASIISHVDNAPASPRQGSLCSDSSPIVHSPHFCRGIFYKVEMDHVPPCMKQFAGFSLPSEHKLL